MTVALNSTVEARVDDLHDCKLLLHDCMTTRTMSLREALKDARGPCKEYNHFCRKSGKNLHTLPKLLNNSHGQSKSDKWMNHSFSTERWAPVSDKINSREILTGCYHFIGTSSVEINQKMISKCWMFGFLYLIAHVLLLEVNSSAIFIVKEDSEEVPDVGVELTGRKNSSHRGLLDILENFRLWQLERKKELNTTTSKPTPEPAGLDAFLPRIQLPKIDENTLGEIAHNINNAAIDIAKSFIGPPPTEPEPDYNGTNISTTIPPNTFFCIWCNL
ncbi:unnamed protein product [Allacma fusca]|uniref:Uncharacterized protein n=1 Tax=Allacma fusca TaxID=39272 RepID=A0A8J2JT05_9HEXA|nr:unnamed protein product [Allacma fusca]